MAVFHNTVLLQAACDYLEVQSGKLYVDCTFGGGGHSAEILRRGGKVLAIDQDRDVIDPGWDNLIFVHDNFTHLAEIVSRYSWHPVSGILIDLGVSLHQIQTPERGFSFQLNGPLDMRMDKFLSLTAAEFISRLAEIDLARILADFADVSRPREIARKILSVRPQTTAQLAQILPDPHLKRQVFQAIRIAVNDELGALQEVLPQAVSCLAPGGRLAVISFHSLEDRLVKTFILDQSRHQAGNILTKKPVTPDAGEIAANPPSHSAKLRVFQKNI
jgi:16S rRNA (cytosine1402-N4)-methyltransferase